MLPTFKAVLKGNQLLWTEEIPETGERSLLVYVTILEEFSTQDNQSRGQQMATVLKQLAESSPFANNDAVAWERENRQDRQFNERD